MQLLVKTNHGLEEVLAKELERIGASKIELKKRAVSFEGDLKTLYRANHELRTALRILKPIHEFTAKSADELYKKSKAFDWSEIMTLNQTFAIDSRVYSDYFDHSKYVALRVKDAIADRFRKETGKRPNVDTRHPDVRIHVHVADRKVTFSLDSSGESLHKRAYRQKGHRAPLNEVLAAGMVLLTAWDGTSPLLDPMCGTGTIALEAAMIAANIPPGLMRAHYGFMNWPDFDQDLWAEVKNEAESRISKTNTLIYASDKNQRSINLARSAAGKLRLGNMIEISQQDVFQINGIENGGTIIMNPPYGERIQERDILDLYKRLGDHLKQQFNGYDAWIISSNKDALKNIGLRPSKKITLFNGPLECKFQKFEMYRGSKKSKYSKLSQDLE